MWSLEFRSSSQVINYSHLFPTRYALELEGLKNSVGADTFKEPSQRKDVKKTVKKLMEERYQAGKNKWFFTALRVCFKFPDLPNLYSPPTSHTFFANDNTTVLILIAGIGRVWVGNCCVYAYTHASPTCHNRMPAPIVLQTLLHYNAEQIWIP
jgi:hypothetical protein